MLASHSRLKGLVQALQNRYQTNRLYKMIAMGKASPMDVTGEGVPELWSPNVLLLFPFLLFIQVIGHSFFCNRLGISNV